MLFTKISKIYGINNFKTIASFDVTLTSLNIIATSLENGQDKEYLACVWFVYNL